MYDWATATVELPRWVVWAALLTSPAVWSRRFARIARERLPINPKKKNAD